MKLCFLLFSQLHPLLLKAEQLIEGDKREQGDVRFSKLKSVLNEVMSPAVIDVSLSPP